MLCFRRCCMSSICGKGKDTEKMKREEKDKLIISFPTSSSRSDPFGIGNVKERIFTSREMLSRVSLHAFPNGIWERDNPRRILFSVTFRR
jgi:hypothetical protein